jgi:hypothetical protein
MKKGLIFPAVLLGILLMSSAVLAAPSHKNIKPTSAHYKQISQCVWYGEDLETKSVGLLGGIGAGASAYFHTCTPYYWYNGKNWGWSFGQGDLWFVYPNNSLYSVETDAYGDVMGAYLKVVASVSIPNSV